MRHLKQRASLTEEDDMKWSLRMNPVLGSLFAALIILSPLQAAQQGRSEAPKQARPEAPSIVRKPNNGLQASAINRVEALYPPSAVTARIFGTVLVEVSIDESGNVSSARALSGHPLLKDAAVDAARGWTFKPTILQGNPVKVVGTLTFNFNLPDYIVRDRTIERLKRQIAINPENPKLYFQIGRAYEDNQQDADALKAYSRAAVLDPEYGEAQVALGSLNMKLNHYDEALIANKQAVLLNLTPEVKAAAYRAIALIYFRRDQFQEAVEPFKQAIALAPQGSLYLNLGLTYLKLGDKTSALEQHRLLKERNSILAQQLLDRINEAK